MSRAPRLERAFSRRLGGQSGSAIVEFVFVAVVVMVPLMYLVLAASVVQRNSFAVTQAAREAGRAFATAPDEATGISRAHVAVDLAMTDQGLEASGYQLRWVASGSGCSAPVISPSLAPGVSEVVCVIRPFRLPAVPSIFEGGHNAVTGRFVVRVDAFRSAP